MARSCRSTSASILLPHHHHPSQKHLIGSRHDGRNTRPDVNDDMSRDGSVLTASTSRSYLTITTSSSFLKSLQVSQQDPLDRREDVYRFGHRLEPAVGFEALWSSGDGELSSDLEGLISLFDGYKRKRGGRLRKSRLSDLVVLRTCQVKVSC